MTDKTLFVVIPVHNRRGLTRRCLESLREQTIHDFSVIVVDDGSADGTGEMIASEFPEVILLRGDGNLWWTRATNLGVQYALERGAAYIMTLNDDTIATVTFLAEMQAVAADRPFALLGALAVDADTGEIVYAGEQINWKTGTTVSLLTKFDAQIRPGLREVTHFPGRGLWIPASVFHTVGMFDAARFPHYAADYDFTHRAIRAGYQVFCNYHAQLLIYPDASGSVQLRKKPNLMNYYDHLFSIKGGANLKVFTHYAWRNCPAQYRPWFMFRGYLQRILGYWYHVLIESARRPRSWGS